MSSEPALSLPEYQRILRNDFIVFVERSFYELNPQGRLQVGSYMELIASKLEAVRKGMTKRLIINLPPRTLKSHMASVAFVAWLLGHKPSTQIICASYGQDLADKHARDCRTLMTSIFYRKLFTHTQLSIEKNAVDEYETTEQGFRMSTSVSGTLTGRGADIIILDDVMKPEDALSDTRRKTANEWYRNTLLSRLNSKENGAIIIVMQRLHQDDVAGNVLEREENWEILSLPAIAEQDEKYLIESPLGCSYFQRRIGEALHPERDSLATLKKISQDVGEYIFQSQYQQSPVPVDGGCIKKSWLRYYDPETLPTDFTMVLQSWDTANKSGELNDFSVCSTWGLYEENYYLLNIFRERLNYPDLKRAFTQQSLRYDPSRILIEDKSSGISLIQELQSDGVCGIEPIKPPPGTDKLMRHAAQSIKFESGRVLLPHEAPWLDEYIREITGFPGTKYDDQVDSTSQALEYLGSKANYLSTWERMADSQV